MPLNAIVLSYIILYILSISYHYIYIISYNDVIMDNNILCLKPSHYILFVQVSITR